jgi:hypothetical protein
MTATRAAAGQQKGSRRDYSCVGYMERGGAVVEERVAVAVAVGGLVVRVVVEGSAGQGGSGAGLYKGVCRWMLVALALVGGQGSACLPRTGKGRWAGQEGGRCATLAGPPVASPSP